MRRLVVSVIGLILLTSSMDVAYSHPLTKCQDFIQDVPSTHIPTSLGRIKKGRDLFFNETFNGNGRTCSTCHEPTKNFTIDPAFIATLPPTSPLFVAENNPNLTGLENPPLMHQFGLILENLDGFDQPGVMRGVPHTLALTTSIKSPPGFPEANALGWGGDGSPFGGALFFFPAGAVAQHFTQTLQRRCGIDFRLPTKQELEDMQEFQLSLGRKTDISLEGDERPALVFNDQSVETGKQLFLNAPSKKGTRSCNACHNDAGANDNDGNNRLFDTGVAKRPDAPACRGVAPGDGGFGLTPVTTVDRSVLCGTGSGPVVFQGDGTFNVPPLVEAADTPPFFHNNAVNTIELAVAHYTTDAFNNSPAGNGNAFVLTQDQINDIGAMLRTINAMENIRRGIDVDNQALGQGGSLGNDFIKEAASETQDAIDVITQAAVPIYQGSNIVALLQQAHDGELAALTPSSKRRSLLNAISLKQQAQSQFVQ